MSLHLVVGRIHFLAKMPRVLGNFAGPTEMLSDMPGDRIVCVSQLCIDDCRFLRLDVHHLGRRCGPGRHERLLRRWWDGNLSLLPSAGLGFGSGSHLSNASQEFFDFVTHNCSKVPGLRSKVHLTLDVGL
jgi:hypothetical protein